MDHLQLKISSTTVQAEFHIELEIWYSCRKD